MQKFQDVTFVFTVTCHREHLEKRLAEKEPELYRHSDLNIVILEKSNVHWMTQHHMQQYKVKGTPNVSPCPKFPSPYMVSLWYKSMSHLSVSP